MKRYLILVSLFVVMMNGVLKAQKYVSTEPQNRNVLIEEFTGRNCGFCPDGHRIANEIVAANPGRVVAVNIHAGGFAPLTYPNMVTEISETIRAGFNVNSFPAGVVNRSQPSASGRDAWAAMVDEQLAQTAEVNVGGQFRYDPDTRIANITVEVYYTANSDESENYLSVFMLQDSILGSQSGSNYNPSQMFNGQYVHQHVLRDVVTAPWGDELTTTTAGTLITKEYTYEIPEIIGDPNGVNVDLDNIFFIAVVTEKQDGSTTRPILNVCKLDYNPAILFDVELCEGESYNENGFNYNNPEVGYYEETIENGNDLYELNLTVHPTYERNLSADICEGEDFNYGVFHFEAPEAGTHTQDYLFTTIHGCDSLIIMTLTVHPSYEQEITAEICEGEDYKENGFNLNDLVAGIYDESLNLETEDNCDSIINLTLTVIENPDVSIDGNTTILEGESTTLTASGADSYVWSTGETTSSITVSPEETTKYSVVGTKDGCDTETEVTVNVTVGISDNNALGVNIYPNPTEGVVRVECDGMTEITVFMPNGQVVETITVGDNVYMLDMNNYKSGVYYLRIIVTEGKMKNLRVLKI